MQQQREEVHAALQFVASFHCVRRKNGKIVKWLEPKPKGSSSFADKRRDRPTSIDVSSVEGEAST